MFVTLILSLFLMAALFLMIFAAVVFIQDKRLFTTAPKDIQEAAQEHKEHFPGARIIGWIILAACVMSFPGAFIYGGWEGVRRGFGFWEFTARFLSMLYLMKAFDIIFLDWFLLTKSHFYQHFYPETEGCAGYHQFGFNRKEQLVQIIIFPFAAVFAAWICTLF